MIALRGWRPSVAGRQSVAAAVALAAAQQQHFGIRSFPGPPAQVRQRLVD